jgi:hypothetical protein
MDNYLALTVLLLILAGLWALLERTHRRAAGLPRLPFGGEADRESDFWRVRHDLDVGRDAR